MAEPRVRGIHNSRPSSWEAIRGLLRTIPGEGGEWLEGPMLIRPASCRPGNQSNPAGVIGGYLIAGLVGRGRRTPHSPYVYRTMWRFPLHRAASDCVCIQEIAGQGGEWEKGVVQNAISTVDDDQVWSGEVSLSQFYSLEE
jgi:hypothetical protein